MQKVPQKHAEGCDPLDSRGRFKALPEKILAKFSDGTSRTRLFAQNGGEKALNRCEVRALQREDLGRTTKEWPCFLRTVGYGWVRKGYLCADARLRSFEKGMFCCKLTAASAILKGLLHVSLGTVEKCCLSGFVKSFSLSVGLA